MAVEIKIAKNWTIKNDPRSSAGLTLQKYGNKNKNKKQFYFPSIDYALAFCARYVINEDKEKVETLDRYLEKYGDLYDHMHSQFIKKEVVPKDEKK